MVLLQTKKDGKIDGVVAPGWWLKLTSMGRTMHYKCVPILQVPTQIHGR